MSKSWPFLLVIALAIGVLAYRGASTRHAPVPPAFDQSQTLEVAMSRSESSGRPVLAFATADWCGPCQAFKRGALADESVASFISDNTETAYIDLTSGDDPEAAEAARLLGVRSIPALVLIDDNREVARLEGSRAKSQLMTWLRDAVGQDGAVSSGD